MEEEKMYFTFSVTKEEAKAIRPIIKKFRKKFPNDDIVVRKEYGFMKIGTVNRIAEISLKIESFYPTLKFDGLLDEVSISASELGI
jgi:hypothetical protein